MFPTKESYRTAWANAYTQDPAVPLNVDIELASICNLRCPFCFYGEADWNASMAENASDGKPKKRIMPTELALRIIDEAAEIGVPALKFNWRGESTLHPDYSKILTYARRLIVLQDGQRGMLSENAPQGSTITSCLGNGRPAFHELLVNTNANCKDHALDGLMAATKVMVSLDSTIPEIYEKMRVNGRLERATEVIKELIRRGHPNLWIRRVITKGNAHEPFKQRVDEIFGGQGYKVSEHHCVDRSTDSSHAKDNPDNYERTYCGYPSQRLMVASDGTCYPCCVDFDTTMPVGNVHKQSILEVWNGEPMRRLRAELRAGQFTSPACKNCTSWMSYKAPQRENVQDKAV